MNEAAFYNGAVSGNSVGAPLRVSVIICSRNPRRDYLDRVLQSLQEQTLPKNCWELVLVDNASSEPLADGWNLTWHPNSQHVREDNVGLTAARRRGILAASGDLLVFVDDDNVLDPDYLRRVIDISRGYRFLGVFGAGTIEPEFETKPIRKTKPWLRMLALRTVSSPTWTNNPRDHVSVPWGAGLCVTSEVASAYLEWVARLQLRLDLSGILDRRDEHLFCGGDDLFSFVCVQLGQGFGIFPALRMKHLIPSRRLTASYLLKLVHDHAYSHGILKYVLFTEQPMKFDLVEGMRLVLHAIHRGLFSAKCRWTVARGNERARRYIAAHHIPSVQSSLAISPPVSRQGRKHSETTVPESSVGIGFIFSVVATLLT